ncbi:carbon monoxide dehydrogenase subunit G [Rubrobacter xylanophilus DSM 9941]|uniref:Carbon monoxide dehydrogenase subunit G n=1 Tax=Rubrobacter xylanophilus (strain DSM 9941 / JCM 11954 / NBRC 16129 / PRD-1) TaxID=266117 RepID=Q1AZT0_RUBXD|nr:SRPBCC family protein [Rubrobacter xylanophilus]ABG03098.1 carbon monoxide dehydrogenase subunit G [Rubrobacter xylanophilus DSM 9941]
MKLENEFRVSSPVQKVWEALLDLERVTPCLPGAALTEQAGDHYKGTMAVKLGPVTARYSGTVRFVETDERARRAVIEAKGRDVRGQGTASATITSTLHEEEGERTRVVVRTEMRLTGRVAQFGRGIQQDVASKIMDRFASCLENEVF